jgi:hypothetical protein
VSDKLYHIVSSIHRQQERKEKEAAKTETDKDGDGDDEENEENGKDGDSKVKDTIRYQYDEHYFLTDPDEFIQEFWPNEPNRSR